MHSILILAIGTENEKDLGRADEWELWILGYLKVVKQRVISREIVENFHIEMCSVRWSDE